MVGGLVLAFVFAGCTVAPQNQGYPDITDLYTVSKNSDNTYTYQFTDADGRLLFEKENSAKAPQVELIAPSVYEIITQTGTGLSTNWAVYCDIENSRTSDIFYYVLEAQKNYVIFVEYENGKHRVIVQDIFDKSAYYKTYELEKGAPAADGIVNCKFNGEDSVTVTYLAGEGSAETEITIQLP